MDMEGIQFESTYHYPSCSIKPKGEIEEVGDEIDEKFRLFKLFDIITDPSDHHYFKSQPSSKNKDSFQVGSSVAKKISNEWKILEKNLPDSIFVRAYEERIDLMRAVIVGSDSTPYHNGLFFFDILFPNDYPAHPPHVYYHSHGHRINPNLYANGKVCLSLLNTWKGKTRENWIAGESTVLQVLISIQALVLNDKPYFNEPGYESLVGCYVAEQKSIAYNRDVFFLSCKMVLYTLKSPKKHFEDFVVGHFRRSAHRILRTCTVYMDGGAKLGEIFMKLMAAFDANGGGCKHVLNQIKKEEEERSSHRKKIKKEDSKTKDLNQLRRSFGKLMSKLKMKNLGKLGFK